MKFNRVFTTAGKDPFECIEWKKFDAVIKGADGKTVFEQLGVEAPASWSQTAVNVVASKYFRGAMGTPEREYSVKQLVGRVVDTICKWAHDGGYFGEEDLVNPGLRTFDMELWKAFRDELKFLLVNQYAAFNSPVWFNVGVEDEPQCSACFINSVEDNLGSILDLAKTEGMLFKYGSGSGVNLSNIRGSREGLNGGGIASGPVSFMKGLDAFAGVIKSGGKTRRAAKMVILDADHPDIMEFINCKANEERKAHALIDAGFDGAIDGEAYGSVFFQNSNNSVRVTDEFMSRVSQRWPWTTINRTTGLDADSYHAVDIWRAMAKAAWECGDPGIQFHDTVNKWHTCKNTDAIYASNPCCFVGSTLVETSEGRISIGELEAMDARGEVLPYALSYDFEKGLPVVRRIKKAWKAGDTKNLVRVTTDKGLTFECTPEHRFYLRDGSAVQAKDLKAGMRLQKIYNHKNMNRAGHRGDVNDTVVSVDVLTLDVAVSVYDIEVEETHKFAIANEGFEHSIIVKNSEYMFLNDTACNLASLNLMKFRKENGSFDIIGFKHAVDVLITAMEVIVGNASYPTEKIKENSHRFRPLGLGYCNLGSLLMANGLAYDSNEGRAYAAAITSLMGGEAYLQSARLAEKMRPFAGYIENSESMLGVIEMHTHAARDLANPERIFTVGSMNTDPDLVIADAGVDAWNKALSLGRNVGFRNSQATVLAPTGTIGFMMDADTTGVEPAIALVAYKKLVGGGVMKIVNQTVGEGLRALGYTSSRVEALVKWVEEHGTLENYPSENLFNKDHLPVFDCAFGSGRTISPMGHVKMMAAVQPFLSGAISKTVNMPPTATIEDIENIYMESWKLGLKAVAVYRDGCKRSQPLNVKQDEKQEESNKPKSQPESEVKPVRRKLKDTRDAVTHKFSIAGHEGYVTVGLYEDGAPGELFIRMSKEGSTVSGLMDAFATAISISLQHGVPLSTLVEKFSHTRYEPSGFTQNPDIRMAKSITDYLFRWMDLQFGSEKRENAMVVVDEFLATLPPPEKLPNQSDAPACATCGDITVRNGSCYKCNTCGSTTGCS